MGAFTALSHLQLLGQCEHLPLALGRLSGDGQIGRSVRRLAFLLNTPADCVLSPEHSFDPAERFLGYALVDLATGNCCP